MRLFCWSLILILSLGSAASADLVAYWPFDTDPNNAQGNTDFDGVVIGSRVSFSSENVAVGTGALRIDDDIISTNFVQIENSPFTGVRTKFSIVGWFLQKDISGDGTDSRLFVLETDDWDVSLGGRSTGVVGEWYLHGSPGWSETSGRPNINNDPNAWRHFALVYNAEAGYGRFYYDGQLRDDRSGTPGVGLNATQYLNIGNHRAGDGVRNFDGYIDDMAVFDRALTDEQVLALYNKTHTPDTVEQLLDVKAYRPGPVDGAAHVNGGDMLSWQAPEDLANPVYNVYLSTDPAMANDVITLATGLVDTSIALPSSLPDAADYYWQVDTVGGEEGDTWSFTTIEGLVAHWTFDTENNLANVQGNTDFDGIAIGNAVVSTDDVRIGTGALKIDSVADGTNYVDIAAAPILGAQSVYSVVGWYKYSDISSDGSYPRNFIFETAPNYSASFGIRSDGGLVNKRAQYVVEIVGGSYASVRETGPVVDDGNWHHVALVWNGLTDSIKYYHDGSLFGSEPVGAADVLAFTDGFHIGKHRFGNDERNWDGYIDDMAIYDVELMPSQISVLFNGFRGPDDVLEELELTAVNPTPSMGGVSKIDGQLSWQNPPDMANPLFNVYLSPDPNMLEDVTTLAENLDGTSVDLPGGLEYETQYYWRVDSVDGASIYEGAIWSFVTVDAPVGLVAWWPFDTDPNDVVGHPDFPDFNGVVIGTRVSFSSENVAVGTGALRIDDDTSSTNFVRIENSPFVGIETEFTITGWFLQKDISGDGMDERPFVLETDDWDVSVGNQSSGEVGEWYIHGSPGWSDTSGPSINDDPEAWRHFALVYNAEEGYGRFYFDGQLRDDESGTPGAGLNATQYLNIGNHRDGDGERNFDGYIDDVAVFGWALSDAQVLALYDKTHTPANVGQVTDLKAKEPAPVDGAAHINAGALLSWRAPAEVADPVYNVYLSTDPAMANDVITLATDLVDTSIALPSGLPDATNYYWSVDTVGGEQGDIWSLTTIEGLVAYWPFDTDPNNAQGNTDFNGIPIGNAVVSADDVKFGTGALKIDDDALGTNYVDIAAAPILGAQDVYSIVGWYKYSDISSNGSDDRNYIFQTTPGYAAGFGIRSDGVLVNKRAQYVVQMEGGDTYGSDAASGPVVDDGNWHHVALVWNNLTNNSIKYYHDGSLFRSEQVDAADALAFADGFHIGNHRAGDGARNWDGYLDDMAIYDVELMSDQILALFNGTRTPEDALEELQLTATDPNPTMGGVADLDGQLSWQAPPDLANPLFNVYFSPDPNMVEDVTTLAQDLDGTSVDLPAGMEYDTQYYWRVDSVDVASIYEGDIWSFSTTLGLVAWWPFDDSANNAQGNTDYDGALIGSATISSEKVAVGTGALRIDDHLSGASYVDITSTVMVSVVPTRNTVVAWYLPEDISGDGSDTRNFIWETDINYSLSFGVRSDVGPGGDTKVAEWYYIGSDAVQRLQPIGDGPVVAGTGADPNTWHHVAMVYDLDADSIKYYHDGELYDEATANAGVLATNPAGFHIGNHRVGDGGRNFDGYIDEVAIYDAALTSYQIRQLVTNPAVDCGNVLQVRKYWADFNDNGGIDLDDLRYFGERWLTDDPEADYDGDGNVDFFDFGTFGEGWQPD